MVKPKFVLRDLPGIAEIEELHRRRDAHPNPNWAPENDLIGPRCEAVSRRLFGITVEDTAFDWDEVRDLPQQDQWIARYEWEDRFDLWQDDEDTDEAGGEDELEVWAALDWDVTDGSGQVLKCLHCFERQIICAARGWRGHLPGVVSDADAERDAEEWARNFLRAEPTQPAPRRGRGRA